MSAFHAIEFAAIVQVTVVTAIALVMIGIARRHAAWRHAIGVSGLLLVFLSPVAAAILPRPFWLSTSELPSDVASAASDVSTAEPRPDGASSERSPEAAVTAPAAAAGPIAASSDSSPSPHAYRAASAAPSPRARTAHWPLRSAIYTGNLLWACGVVWLAWRRWKARVSIDYLFRSLRPWSSRPALFDEGDVCRELGLQELPPILLSELAPTPLVLGEWKPVIVLPCAFAEAASAEAVRSVVIHEAAHVARRDHWILAVEQAAQVLFWWHPGVRWLNQQINRSREEICDNYVLRRSNATGYAEILLELAERRPAPLLLGLFSSRWSLEERIAGILSPRRKPVIHARPDGIFGLMMLLLTISVFVGGAGFFDLSSSPAAPPKPEAKSNARTAGRTAASKPAQPAEDVSANAETRQAQAALKKITVRGVCVDDQETPLANVRVRVFRYPSPLDAPLLVADVQTDKRGTFVARDVATAVGSGQFHAGGDLVVAATADGHVSALWSIKPDAVRKEAPPVDPFADRAAVDRNSADLDAVDVSLVLPGNPGTLSGTVTDESGRPVAGVVVFLSGTGPQPLPGIRSAVTDEAGHYALNDLKRWTPADTETFDPKTGFGTIMAYCNLLLDHPAYARTIAHYSGVPQTVDVTLHPPAIVEGTVIDAVDDRPAANVVVSAQGVVRSGWYQTKTDGQGRFRLRMTKDYYNIWAEADDRIPIAAKAIEAAPGKTASIPNIRLVRGGFVTGRVIDPTTNEPPQPVDDRPLRVAHYGPARPRTGAAVTSAVVEADGTYRLRVAPGKNYVYLMSGSSSHMVTVEDGREIKLDLVIGQSTADAADFAADLQLAARLRHRAQDEDARPVDLPANAPAKRATERASRQRHDTPTGRLLDKLEGQNAGGERFKDAWCRTLKEIVDLGPAALPELIEELDATENDLMLRCLGFTLRAIGDARAVPALVRAIPKTLRPPGSDMGLTANDDELVKFAQQHDLHPADGNNHYGFGRPVREIFGALQKLTGQNLGEEQLFHIFLNGLPSQRRMKRELYQRTAQAWAEWWEKDWAKHVGDAAYSRVELAPLVAQEAKAPPPTGMHFKVESGASGWVLESVLNPRSKTVFYDFDTGRVAALPHRWRAEKNIESRLDEIAAWACEEGFDLMGTEYASPGDGERVFAIRPIELRAWELGSHRWKMRSNDITLEALKEEGTPADALLLHRDKESQKLDPKAIGTFLYVTREGTPGLLFVGVEVQDDGLKPGDPSVGDLELQAIAFRKGRRFGYRNFEESPLDGKASR